MVEQQLLDHRNQVALKIQLARQQAELEIRKELQSKPPGGPVSENDLQLIVISNQTVRIQQEQQWEAQLFQLEQLVRDLRVSGATIAATQTGLDNIVLASNGRPYSVVEVTDVAVNPAPLSGEVESAKEDSIEAGIKELEAALGDQEGELVIQEEPSQDADLQADLQAMIHLELKDDDGGDLVEQAEKILKIGTDEPEVDFENAF